MGWIRASCGLSITSDAKQCSPLKKARNKGEYMWLTHIITTFIVTGFLSLLLWAAQREKPTGDPEAGTLLFRFAKSGHVLP
jgi:hypothetical protein